MRRRIFGSRSGSSLFALVAYLAGVLPGTPPPSSAQTTIVVSDPGRKFPIALPQLCLQGGDTVAPKEVPRTISRDLDLSGYFDVLSPASYVEQPGKCVPPDAPEYTDWNLIRAEWLVRGTVSGSGDRVTIQLFLHDVPRQRAVVGKSYEATKAEIPLIAHKFANEIMKYVTGESGPFGSKIAFSVKTGRFKDLFVMDMDGSNIRQLTNERGLALSPAWDPTGRQLAYTSYRQRVPDIYIIDAVTGVSRPVTRGPALEVGAVFAPGGGAVVASVTGEGETDLVMYDARSGSVVRRLTPPNRAIDVSASYSPDGKQMAFCSDRADRPQIYVMGSDGSNGRRISFVSSNYCTSPRWSPKGDRIAFVCRSEGGFHVFLADPDGSNAIQITSDGSNEDPDWSPDGRYLVFSSTMGKGAGYDLAMVRVIKNLEGTNLKQLTSNRMDDTSPAWGPVPQ